MTVSKRMRFEILRRDNHQCQYCGERAPDVTLHVDHVKPKTLGGTDSPENLVTACKDCNAGKSSTPSDASHVAAVSARNLEWQKNAAELGARMRGTIDRDKSFANDFAWAWESAAKLRSEDPTLPDGYEATLYNWSGMGVPIEAIDAAVQIAMNKRGLEPGSRFKYLAGIIWNQIKSHQLGELEPESVHVYTEQEYWDAWQEGCDAGQGRIFKMIPKYAARYDPLSLVIDRISTPYINQARWSA